MRKIIFLVLFVILSLFAQPMRCFALSVGTHEAINEYIVKNSVGDFSLGNYLNSNLDFSKGYEEYVNGHEVYIWLRDGGRYEDKPPLTIPYSRSFNHYLNPINNTGYQGVFKSALEWSHSQGEFGSLFGGDYSWPAVRSYYLNALISSDKAARDNYFAETFRGVGQLMHLVEDMSVPAHTRNDGHVLYNYEDWVEDNSTVVANGSANPIYFSGAMSTYDPLFLDLAAFSNANFLTDDTIFSGFTYPRIEDTELWTDTANNRDYLRKLASSTGVQVDHLAASSWLYFYRLRYFPATDTFLPLGLDDKVYSDYAALLIPRAVGYSAGLINYFFRGQIDMKPDTQNAGKYVIENFSNEDMSGAFSLYYDDENDNRNLVTNWNLSISAGGKSESIEFIEPTDTKEKGKYMLVFSGALGAEEGAVAGKVVTLAKGKWEDWDGVKQTTTYYASLSWEITKRYTLETDKYAWSGFWRTHFSPDIVVKAEDGVLKINAYTGTGSYSTKYSFYGPVAYGWIQLPTPMVPVPVSGCRFEMSIPEATVGYANASATGDFYMYAVLHNGNSGYWAWMGYKIKEVSYLQMSSADDVFFTWISSSEIKRNLEEDFRALVTRYDFSTLPFTAEEFIDNINYWQVETMGLRYSLSGENNSLNIAIDYIDFVCE